VGKEKKKEKMTTSDGTRSLLERAENLWTYVLQGPSSPSGGLSTYEVLQKLVEHLGGATELSVDAVALLDPRNQGKVTLESFKLFSQWFGLDENTLHKVKSTSNSTNKTHFRNFFFLFFFIFVDTTGDDREK